MVAATRDAAEVCGVGVDLGTVEVGKLADLIVVCQNPLEDIDNLRTLELVIKEGHLVADHRHSRHLTPPPLTPGLSKLSQGRPRSAPGMQTDAVKRFAMALEAGV